MGYIIEENKQRKFFYRDNFRLMCRALVATLFINAALVLLIFYLILSRGEPSFYASSSDGEVTEVTPLSGPNMSSTPLLE